MVPCSSIRRFSVTATPPPPAAFCTDQHWILMMGGQEHCSLVLVMHRDGILGRARFQMDRALELLNREL